MNLQNFRISIMYTGVIIPVLCVITACKGPVTSNSAQIDNDTFLIDVKYARGFNIDDYGSYMMLDVFNPWQNLNNKKLSYLLYKKGTSLPQVVNYDVAIQVPVQRVICMSTTHIAIIGALGETGSIAGVSGSQYINDSIVREGIENGAIPDIGYEQSINYEMILAIKPDVIFMYGVTGDITATISRIESLGIPVVLDAEYLENNPLARTEWIKFIACFYDKLEKGTVFFNQQEEKYLNLQSMVSGISCKPDVMTGLPWKNTWWVPGGKSFASKLISDAGGRYLWENDTLDEALPLDIESVYDRAVQADIWINSGSASSLEEIINTDPRLALFRPYKESKIYNNNAKLNLNGGNDYWESGVIYPGNILKDLISIFHPEILPGYELVYYRKLE
jgi:iron complex transport system substrate-binding protein